MSRITGSEVYGLMEAYNAVYSPQINEDYIWESCLTEEFISEAYQTVADYLVHNGFVPGYNTAEVYMSEMAVEDIDSILFETGVLNEQYLIEAGFFQGLGAGADKFVSGAKKNIQGAASNVQRVGQTAVGGAQRLGTAAVGAVKADIGNKIKVGQAVVGGAQRLGTAAVGAVKDDIGNKIKMGQAIAGGVQKNVTPVAQAVQGTAQRAVNAVGGVGKAITNKIGQEVEISRKVGAGEPLGGSPTAKSTPSRFAGARDAAIAKAQNIKGSPVVGPKIVGSGTPTPAAPAPGARPATPAASMAKPATPAAKPATPAATTGNPPLKPPALPPITGKPSLKSGIDDLKKMGDASRQRQASMLNQSFDPFDYILEYLVAEGYADTNEAAISIMANMSEEWRVSIVEEVLDEGDNYDKNRKRAAQRAAARNAARDAGQTGAVPGVGYVTPRRENETYRDSAGTERHKSGARMPEKKG